jgi:two-component system, response regulator YesN
VLKLLIADDEYLVLDSIKMIVAKNLEDISIVGTASTGREAIEKAISLKPDIVFMDIHMPGINGIDAIRQIKTSNQDIEFVILTAYEYFDYAKESLNLGVYEYMLKPINKVKLIETLRNVGETIAKKRDNLLKSVELTEKINSIIPFLEGQFLTHKLFNVGPLNEIGFYEDIFKMKLRHGYALTVLFLDSGLKEKENTLKLNHEKQRFYDVFKIKLKCITPCLVGTPLSDRIIAYIPTSEQGNVSEVKCKSLEIGIKLAEKIKELTDINFQIGIGSPYSVNDFSKSCNEAYISASSLKSQTVMHIEGIKESIINYNAYPVHFESSFSNSIVRGNIVEAREIFKEIYLWLSSAYEDINIIKSKLLDLMFAIEKHLPYKLESFSELKQTYILNILKAESKEDLRLGYLQYLSKLENCIKNHRDNDIDGIIPTVMDYLNKNYSQDISLTDAAKSVNLSYHYFSKIFKDELGKSFTDYLTELRIEKSMKLLANPNTNIKEICQKIGYNDPNYYCKAFKKLTGMTPTEYRSSINVRGDCVG